MITPNTLHHLTEDPAEGLAKAVLAKLAGAEKPPNPRVGGALSDWCHSKVRWFASPHLLASTILRAAALVAERYERK